MDFSTLFATYYVLYRGEATTPDTTDPEWAIAIRFYNDAILRMQAMDDTKWNFLWNNLQLASDGTKTLTTGTVTYDAPTDMAEPGGQLTYIDSNNNRINYPIVQPHEAQTLNDQTVYGYFTGDQQTGFVLHVNPAPTATENGFGIDYNYYRKPIELDVDNEDGFTTIEGGDPAYYYNHMLAQRFRVSRNWPAYQTALRDSEEALKGMKLKNNSGSYYNAWGVQDTGPGWGDSNNQSSWGW